MNNNLAKGLTLLATASSLAYLANKTKDFTQNTMVKEFIATVEVVSHLISYMFYGDAYADSFRHIIDGEIVARFNMINPKEFYLAVPYVAEVMVDDLSDVFNIDSSGNPLKYAAPYIAGYGLKYLSKAALTKDMFSYWGLFSHLPEELPSPHAVGLISAISYNLINIPYIGEFLDYRLNGALTSINEWKDNPGGDTYVGEFYREYILYTWEKIHKPHHFYEEILAIDEFKAGGDSPLVGEWEAFWQDLT